MTVLTQNKNYRLATKTYQSQNVVEKTILNQQFKKDFASEIEIFKKLKNQPGFAKLIQSTDTFYYRTWIAGQELSQFKQKLSPKLLLHITHQILNIISRAHQNNIVLGDIKPDNFIVDADHQLTFVDLSLAQLQTKPRHQTAGTAAYMAPELFYGEKLSVASDLYALGVLLYELTTGSPPFAASSITAMAHHHGRTPVVDPTLFTSFDSQWGLLILRLLNKKACDRFLDTYEVMAALNQAFDQNFPLPDQLPQANKKEISTPDLITQALQDVSKTELVCQVLYDRGEYAAMDQLLDKIDNPTRQKLAAQRHLKLGQTQEAQAKAESLLKSGFIKAHNILGTCAYHQKDYPKAFHHYQTLLEHYQSQNNFNDSLSVLNNLAHVKMAQKDFEAAKAYYDQSLHLAKRLGNRHNQALALSSLASFYHQQDYWGQAVSYYQQADQLLQALGLKQLRLQNQLNLANILIIIGFTDKAAQLLNQIEDAAHKQNNTTLLEAIAKLKNDIDNPSSPWQKTSIAKIEQQLKDNQKLDTVEKLRGYQKLVRHGLRAYEKKLARLRSKIIDHMDDVFIEKLDQHYELKPSSSLSPQLSQTLVDLSLDLISELDLSRLLEKTLDQLIHYTEAERGFIILNKPHAKPELALSRHFDGKNLASSQARLSWSLTHQVLESAQPILTLDVEEEKNIILTQSIHDLKLKTIICLPFVFKNEVLGAIYLDSKQALDESRRQEILNNLTVFAAQIAIALANAKLFEQQQTSLKQTQQQLSLVQETLAKQNQVESVVTHSPAMQKVMDLTQKVSASSVPVLITGESGVGKEKIARLIHALSPRADKSFLPLNCGAIPENLLESELFGYQKGAFSGADKAKKGLFELVGAGTLFLDEIGEMSLAMQVKLLRVLQEKEFRPIGSEKTIRLQARLINATNRDLKKEIKNKKFREDLYYRIHVAHIELPPLRERREDIPYLVQDLTKKICVEENIKLKTFSSQALTQLLDYTWPGNVRELQNVLYKSIIFSDGNTIKQVELDKAPESSSSPLNFDHLPSVSLSSIKKRIEKQMIEQALKKFRGNVSHTAKHLNVARPRLSLLLKEHQIDRLRYQ